MFSRFTAAIQPKHLLLGLLAVVYTITFFASHQLKGPAWADEYAFYTTSQQFSQQFIPSFDQLRNYKELNTPLPFIIYGQIQYLFKGGLFSGRLLTYGLSIAIAILIGWTGNQKRRYASILALIGFFSYPYFLHLSTLYYTDIIAAFFALLGLVSYQKNQNLLSSLAFILAISSRQYLIVFPVAIASHELANAITRGKRLGISFFLAIGAALSFFGWVILFGGLFPSSASTVRPVPIVQQSLWFLAPSSGLFALACIGLYYVIPEWLLFQRSIQWRAIWNRRNLLIFACVLILCIVFPPYSVGSGLLWKFSNLPLLRWATPLLFLGLICITCYRFARLELELWLVCWHTLIMMKAHPWDKYALPILMALWFLKVHGFEQNLFSTKTPESV